MGAKKKLSFTKRVKCVVETIKPHMKDILSFISEYDLPDEIEMNKISEEQLSDIWDNKTEDEAWAYLNEVK